MTGRRATQRRNRPFIYIPPVVDLVCLCACKRDELVFSRVSGQRRLSLLFLSWRHVSAYLVTTSSTTTTTTTVVWRRFFVGLGPKRSSRWRRKQVGETNNFYPTPYKLLLVVLCLSAKVCKIEQIYNNKKKSRKRRPPLGLVRRSSSPRWQSFRENPLQKMASL